MDDSLPRHVCQGDLISLFVDSVGYFGAPSFQEPIPERSDPVSHLRAIVPARDDEEFPSDFNSRCTFIITGEKGSIRPLTKVAYGSFIRLKLKATNATVVAQHQEDNFEQQYSYNTVCLRNSPSRAEEKASIWQVLTRYRLRNEGDPIESDDFIVLRNFLFKDKYLTSVPPRASHDVLSRNHLIGLRRDDAFHKLGWKIRVMLPYNLNKKQRSDRVEDERSDKSLLDRSVGIVGGMFIRLTHLESNGHFMARYDDVQSLSSSMAPLGRFTHQFLSDPTHNVAVFVRGRSVDLDPNSAMSIWQILPSQLNKLGPICNGDAVRFRHVLTGQFLCIRQVYDKDSTTIRTKSTMKNGDKSPQPFKIRPTTNDRRSFNTKVDKMTVDNRAWAVATTSEADSMTLFHILTSDAITDGGEDSIDSSKGITISNESDVFFLHQETHLILEEKKSRQLKKKRRAKKTDTKANVKWEEYAEDINIRPSRFNDSNVAVLREVYNIAPVPEVEVFDVLYAAKFLPVIKSAIVTVQYTKKLSELYLPLFRHLNIAVHTLICWVMNQNDSDSALLDHPSLAHDESVLVADETPALDDENVVELLESDSVDESEERSHFDFDVGSELSGDSDGSEFLFEDDGGVLSPDNDIDGVRFSTSAMGPWVGRGFSPFKLSSIVNPIPSARDVTFTDFNVKRQNIVSDSRILDLMIFFTTVVFRLLKDQVLYIDSHSKKNELSNRVELESKYRVPSILTGTCILVHDLIHCVASQNCRNSVRLLSVKGNLLNIMDQEILGWSPPIDTLLIALQSKKRGTVRQTTKFDPTMVLDDQNIHNLIKKTYELYMTNNESAVNLMKLLATLCSPGHIPNRTFQSLIMQAIFKTELVSDAVSSEDQNMASGLSHCLLFSIRKYNSVAWQVKFKNEFKVNAYYSDQATIRKAVLRDISSLRSLIKTGSDGRMSVLDARDMLTILGVGGASLYEESNELASAKFEKVMEWYWRKRGHYFPSSRNSLNEMSYEDVKKIVSSDTSILNTSGNNIESAIDLLDKCGDSFTSDSESEDEASEEDSDQEDTMIRQATNTTTSGRPQSKITVNKLFRKLFLRDQASSSYSNAMTNEDEEGASMRHAARRLSDSKHLHEKTQSPLRISRENTRNEEIQLTAEEEFFEFREQVLEKVPGLDIGTIAQHQAGKMEYDSFMHRSGNKSNFNVLKQGLSVFLLSSTEKAMANLKKSQKEHKSSHPWEGLFQVLTHSSFERDWLRQGIILMAELCRGENLQAQTLVNRMFPASMVLDLLAFGGENSDKLAVVTLLQNLYVVHDFVFSAKASSAKNAVAGTVCSINEGGSSYYISEAGKLFNDMTRRVNREVEDRSAKVLRRMLWRNLSNEMNDIDLNSPDNGVLAYHTALLTLIKELLWVGFFDEADDFEMDAKKANSGDAMSLHASASKRSRFSFFKSITTKSMSFNKSDIQRMLVKKIIAMLSENRNNFDNVRSGVLKTLDQWKTLNRVSDGEHAIIRHKILKNSSQISVGSDHIKLINEYFSDTFGNSVKILLVQEVVTILDLIFDSQQLLAVTDILRLLTNTEQFFEPSALRGESSKEIKVKFSGVPQKIKDLFSELKDEAEEYTDALLALTLFSSDKVKSFSYELLYKNSSRMMNAYQILKNLQIHVSPKKAEALRLIQQFQYVCRKYAHQMMFESLTEGFDYWAYITFCLESIKSICRHKIHYRDITSFQMIKNRIQGIAFLTEPLTAVPLILPKNESADGGIELVPTRAYGAAIGAGSSSLLSITSKYASFFDNMIEDHTSDACSGILQTFLKDINGIATYRHGQAVWSSLDRNQRFYVDSILDLSATICCKRPNLIIELLVDVANMAFRYIWESPGAMRVAELLSEYSDVTEFVAEDELWMKLEELFDETVRDNKPHPEAVRLLRAILDSGRSNDFVKKCHSFVDQRLLRDGSMRRYILLDMVDPTALDIDFHFQVLRLLCSFSSISSKTVLARMKASLSLEFCTQLLSTNCPLQTKLSVLNICENIYTSKETQLLTYISRDLSLIHDITESEKTEARHLDLIIHPLVDYIAGISTILFNFSIDILKLKKYEIESCKKATDIMIRKRSFVSNFTSTAIVIPAALEKELVELYESTDSNAFVQFLDCVLPLYNVIRSPKAFVFLEQLISRGHVDIVSCALTAAFMMMVGLTKSKQGINYAKDTMKNRDLKVNPNVLIMSHLEAAIVALAKRREAFENCDSRENFLMLDGIDLFNKRVSHVLLASTREMMSGKKDLSYDKFVEGLDHIPDLSHKAIQQTTLFQVLSRHLNHCTTFMENGGKQLIEGNLLNETSLMKKTTDFDKWIMCGGYYFRGLGLYMQNFSQPNAVNFFLLHVLCELLDNDIDEIRESDKPIRKKIKLVGKEVERLQRLQDTFENLGICDLVLAVVGRSLDDNIDSRFVVEFVPLALKVGFSLLASGNDSVQDALIRSYKEDHSSGLAGSSKKHFLESLRKIIRSIMFKIERYTKIVHDRKQSDPIVSFPLEYLKILIKIYDFCGGLCGGHNDNARNFLRDQGHVGEPTDIVFDIAKSVNSLLAMLVTQMHYITFDQFYEHLAPPVWPHYPDIKRRFIKWHDSRTDFEFTGQILSVLSSGFNALTEIVQGPCLKNQPSALVATPYCQELLEYVGVMQLRTSVPSGKKNFLGTNSFLGTKSITWDGRHPLPFYRTYRRELKKLGRFQDDPDCNLIVKLLESLGENGKEAKQYNAKLRLLTRVAQDAEQSCLRFLLAMLEATSPLASETLVGQLNDGILLQNMESHYKLSFESSGRMKKFRSEVTVSYLTLISIMASTLRDDPNALIDDFLIQWKKENAAQGYDTEKLVASIEVTSQDGSVQRVYFAIPEFVSRYWYYPEVQKAKEKFLWNVSRESPEDKLSDFYERSKGLMQVMRRQEALRRRLTPLIHGIFGGVNFFVEKIFFLKYFKMQPLFLLLSVCFNLVNMYWQFRKQYPWIQQNEYPFVQYVLEHKDRDQVVFYFYITHFALACALFIRAVLNSPAADNFQPTLQNKNRILFDMFKALITLVLTVLDSWWQLCLVAFSALGIMVNPYFFAPILLDIISQIRLMSFLLEAIVRNIGRITYTLLLAIIFLYLFAVITVAAFENQYALAGKSACNDVLSCFKLQIDYGLVNPPEWIGDGYIDPYMGEKGEESTYGFVASIVAGSVFNFSYIILINLVLQAIISGLIIDTFSEMRAENEEIEVDIRERCFICSIERDEFEQVDIPFSEHIKTEHNMWQYIWFIIYLESKDPLSYTGPEQYLAENLTDKNGFVRLGPIRKSLSISLKAGNAKEKINLKTLLNSIREGNTAQNEIRSKLNKTEKLSKENIKALMGQKSKLAELERAMTKANDGFKSTASEFSSLKGDLKDMIDQLNKKSSFMESGKSESFH